MTFNPHRQVPKGALLALELQEQEANHICNNGPTIPWHKLARLDGRLALAVLTENELGKIAGELKRQGLPPEALLSAPDLATGITTLIWHTATLQCPEGEWYDASLVSAVACATLLSLAQQAWGYDPEKEAKQESANFAQLLGVATDIETV